MSAISTDQDENIEFRDLQAIMESILTKDIHI